MQPAAPRDQRYSLAYLFGATYPARDRGAAFVLPFANTNKTNQHRAEICTTMTLGADAVLIADGAGWHQTGDKL